jgi:hypothetical protein
VLGKHKIRGEREKERKKNWVNDKIFGNKIKQSCQRILVNDVQ